jgi:hypothetical protein
MSEREFANANTRHAAFGLVALFRVFRICEQNTDDITAQSELSGVKLVRGKRGHLNRLSCAIVIRRKGYVGAGEHDHRRLDARFQIRQDISIKSGREMS